mmetsp:Transcript_14912/g.32458  ORF Transcript_14912/g.32458 Transcript_14912/m.32458 type:complete len:298 (-) Transcript_14912:95-988(-)|eukprot:CAMPEP_0178505068 /NCGR_PEP_ID=MMETSP0696-20121128/18933_1 /TAXON_ID=265572 /ORGANISM="Extubocellulus spinifer, Strain CCMP396" /LENGTH=297 /DNA_ID=CAMNT_0020134353 /DNA_START=163 /DNA_END=1059 /DNA_ORIENTATION=+
MVALLSKSSITSLCKPQVLLTTVGSGPFGERKSDSHIYTLGGQLPKQLDLLKSNVTQKTQRTDYNIGAGGIAFKIDGILSPDEADALAAISESVGYSRFAPAIRTAPGMRQNSAAHWIPSEEHAEAFLDPMYERFVHLLPPTLAGGALHGRLSRRVAHYKYDDGDVFNRHTDGAWPGQSIAYDEEDGDGNKCKPSGISEWPNLVSRLTMLLYLNDESDGVQGGNTRLFHTTHDGTFTDVSPKKGSALFFRHGFDSDSIMHMGTQVHGDVPKYVVRLNVLYDVPPPSDDYMFDPKIIA